MTSWPLASALFFTTDPDHLQDIMETLLNLAIALALLFVVIVLGMGLWNMVRGGPGNTSQKLMRLRVMGQAVALVLLLGALFFFGGGRG